jgi:hypothetical protein
MSASETLRLWNHIFGDLEGYLVTFTGRQQPKVGVNNLTDIRQQSHLYPQHREEAAGSLMAAAVAGRDAYFGVHLLREAGNRRRDNAGERIWALWLDEDDGQFPKDGPEPTAIIASSAKRRHLYWRLACMVAPERAVSINKRIAAAAAGDSGKAALATVLRAPGTFNFKRGSEGEPVRMELTGVEAWEPETLEELLPPLPEPELPATDYRRDYPGEYDLIGFLSGAGVAVQREVSSPYGAVYEIECPWESEHTTGGNRDTVVGVLAGGGAWFKCMHDHCSERGWREFREAVAPTVMHWRGSIYARRRGEVSIG